VPKKERKKGTPKPACIPSPAHSKPATALPLNPVLDICFGSLLTGSKQRRSRCAIEAYKKQRRSRCAIEAYKKQRRSRCAIEAYKKQRHSRCAIEAYKSNGAPVAR